MMNTKKRNPFLRIATPNERIDYAIAKASAHMETSVLRTSREASKGKRRMCMPGAMCGVGGWVENFRDDIPDLVTSEGVGGRDGNEVRENSRRIAACWNALAYFSTEEIEKNFFVIDQS